MYICIYQGCSKQWVGWVSAQRLFSLEEATPKKLTFVMIVLSFAKGPVYYLYLIVTAYVPSLTYWLGLLTVMGCVWIAIFMRDRYVHNVIHPSWALQGRRCFKTVVLPVFCHNKYNMDLGVGQQGKYGPHKRPRLHLGLLNCIVLRGTFHW